MKNISINEQVRRYVNRWIFDCANRLITEEGMERKRAFAQAKKALHLLEKLGMGEARFEYLKANGELRKARGTLCHGISSVFDNYEFKNDRSDEGQREPGVIVYFDLDKEAFRSLHISNLIIRWVPRMIRTLRTIRLTTRNWNWNGSTWRVTAS